MTQPRALLKQPDADDMDRRVIRVDFPPPQAGIAAALRRAFTVGREDQSADRDFHDLLSRLH